MTRCTGHCCRALSLQVGPDELRAMYNNACRLLSAVPLEARGPMLDIIAVFESLTYLGFMPAPYAQRVPDPTPKHFYTCRHVLPNGNCEIYETRMRMCRRHPVNGACNYAECTL